MNLKNNRLHKNIFLDYLYTFINNLNMSSSIWVLYLAYRGMSLLEIGLLEGLFHVTSTICEVPSGAIADLWGRKNTLIGGRICIAIACLIMLFSRSFPFFALAFIIQALGYNLNSGSEEALLYDSMKLCGEEEAYLGVNGRLNFLIEVSQAIAIVTGGILSEYSFFVCYAVCFLIALLGLLPALLMTEPPIEKAASGSSIHIKELLKKHFTASISILRKEPYVRNIIFRYSVLFAAYTLLFFYSQQYFSDLGLNKIQISILMLFAGISSCLGAISSDRLSKLFKTHITKISAVMIALSLLLFGSGKLSPAVLGLFVSSYFNSLLYPIQSASLNQRIPSEQRATLISVNSMVFSLFMIAMFPTAGALADIFGLSSIFLGLGILLLFSVCQLFKPLSV